MSHSRPRNARKGTPAGTVLDRIAGDDPKLRAAIHEQTLNVLVAEMIHEARTTAGVSQAQLAKLIGTTQSVISRSCLPLRLLDRWQGTGTAAVIRAS